MGSVDYPFNPLSLALGADANVRCARHRHGQAGPSPTCCAEPPRTRGGSPSSRSTRTATSTTTARSTSSAEDKENRMYLKHGEVAGDTGIPHDETDLATAFALSRVTFETHGTVPLGVFPRRAARQLRRTGRSAARKRQGLTATCRRLSARATPGPSLSYPWRATQEIPSVEPSRLVRSPGRAGSPVPVVSSSGRTTSSASDVKTGVPQTFRNAAAPAACRRQSSSATTA